MENTQPKTSALSRFATSLRARASKATGTIKNRYRNSNLKKRLGLAIKHTSDKNGHYLNAKIPVSKNARVKKEDDPTMCLRKRFGMPVWRECDAQGGRRTRRHRRTRRR